MPFSDDEQILVSERPKLTNTFLILGAALFFVSLLLTAFCTNRGCRPSYEAFLSGWLVMLDGGAGMSWLANPMLFTSWILLDKSRKNAWIFALLAVAFCFSFLSFDNVLENTAGHRGVIQSVNTGYWLWTASSFVTLIGTIYIRFNRKVSKIVK